MVFNDIHKALEGRVLVLDGALGTMIQRQNLEEEDFRGERFAASKIPLKGCNDVLVLTRPDVLTAIHEAYLDAGADIISTDSFNANAISLADYGLEAHAAEISRAAAQVARAAADKFTALDPSRPRFVAGSIGPTSHTAALAAGADDTAARDVTFRQLADAYIDQVRGLVEGGADLLLIETIFDTLNAKAALFAISGLGEELGREIPVMVSGTIADISGRTLSGQTVEAFYTSLAHGDLLSVGLNCAFGARQMLPCLERMAGVAECRVSAHPNAGLPNLAGGYDETPKMFAADIEHYMSRGLVNIVGGCCGTTPEHIRLVAGVAARYSPRQVPQPRHQTVLAGLEPVAVTPENNFINIGERANVAGSARFARLIREGNFDEAVAVARDQVPAGAQVVDVCMDDGMIDGEEAMRRFLLMAAAEPELARVPMMIDSSAWSVLEAGLQCVQGKSIVNSISLKEGEAEFVRRARLVRRYGAAAVVMLFDERGQADTFDRKIEVAERAYKVLTDNDFPPEDIIFDPNVLAVATGVAAHDNYAVDFIEATRWIKANLPHAKVSAGVSNLSFAFRGNNRVREAMHSVFLYHAIAAGLDMGIVNAAMVQVYSDIDPELLTLVEDVVMNRRPDATERLAAWTEQSKASGSEGLNAPAQQQPWGELPLTERITSAVLKGLDSHIAADALEAYHELGSPLAVIDTLLMPAMGEVGEMFGAGKMFLPQVVKSARVMRRAVDALKPYIDGDGGGVRKPVGRIIMATVRGDVHDIGKNIVSVVSECNGYEVIDLGVMVEAERIAEEAEAQAVDAVGLSGLITPSLDEMVRVAREFQRRGLRIPIIIGGATTSALHTAVRIAPEYDGPVIHSRDAAGNVRILAALTGPSRERFIEDLRSQQELERQQHQLAVAARRAVPLAEARAGAYVKPASAIVAPAHVGRIVFHDYPIAEVEQYINWPMFFAAWEVRGQEARRGLKEDALRLLERIKTTGALRLEGVVGIFPARREGDDIVVEISSGREIRLPQLRNQGAGGGSGTVSCSGSNGCSCGCSGSGTNSSSATGSGAHLSVADWVSAEAQDYIGAFALTAGVGLAEFTDKLRGEAAAGGEADDYSAIMAKLLADRLTEAFAESVHEFVRRVAWGYQPDALAPHDAIHGRYRGLRYAFGYPATPDHSLKQEVFELLGVRQTTAMRLTDNYMITPGESLCGIMVADADARYFDLGPLSDEQLADYATRRGKSTEQVKKLIIKQ